MKRMKTFGELNPGDTFYELNGLSFVHLKVDENVGFDGLSKITFHDPRITVTTENFLDDASKSFPFYASLEQLESDLVSSLNITQSLLKEGLAC